MKKQYLILLLAATQMKICFAQVTPNYCGSPRFDTEVYSGVTITSNISYGSNINYAGNNINLTMDIYQPTGDPASIRPLIIWVHGGSFVFGTKNDADVTSLCNHFAKRGYVCASINYRLGIPIPPSQETATKAVYRAVQDLKAAVRYFRKNAATTNSYKVDPEMIFAGGSSAGAFTALHLAYLDQPSELPAYIDTMELGGLEGNSGNPGYSSHVNAIVNLCGALGDTAWMKPGDIPVCSMHGTSDPVVPYATAMLSLGGFQIMVVNGSYSVNQYANAIGVQNAMYTFYGGDHVPFASNTSYMDTTVRFVSNFLYAYMGCAPADPNPLPNTFVTTAIPEISALEDEITVYPNPAVDHFTIQLNNSSAQKLVLTDVTGRMIRTIQLNAEIPATVDKGSLSAGMYFLKIYVSGKIITKKICFQ